LAFGPFEGDCPILSFEPTERHEFSGILGPVQDHETRRSSFGPNLESQSLVNIRRAYYHALIIHTPHSFTYTNAVYYDVFSPKCKEEKAFSVKTPFLQYKFCVYYDTPDTT
jgi:hypothetical protein